MKAIVFSTASSIVPISEEVTPLKGCYLFADRLVVAGQTGADLTFEKDFKYFNVLKRSKLMLSEYKMSENENRDEMVASFEHFIKATKQIQNYKHPPRDLFVSYNKMLSIYDGIFKGYVEHVISQFDLYDISDMANLLGDDIIEIILPEMSVGHEFTGKDAAERSANCILSMMFPSKNEAPSILAFPSNLAQNPYDIHDKFTTDDVKEDDLSFDDIHIFHTFTIPSVAGFSPTKLKAIRNQLIDSGIDFRKKIDEWIMYCKDDNTAEMKIEYFNNEVYPNLFECFNTYINNNLLVNKGLTLPLDAKDIYIYMGVASLKAIWKFYEYYKILDEPVLTILRNKTSNMEKYPDYLPVMCFMTQYRNKDEMIKIDADYLEEGIVFNKHRFISID